MRFVRRYLLPTAGVTAIALLIAIASPRAVQAVTAALVQIVNTPGNAVPVVQAPAAAQRYYSNCTDQIAGGTDATCYLTPVPAGQTLFVETISVQIATDMGNPPYVTGFAWQTGNLNIVWIPMFKQATDAPYVDWYQGTLAVKVMVPASIQPSCGLGLHVPSKYGAINCQVFGYLAPAQ